MMSATCPVTELMARSFAGDAGGAAESAGVPPRTLSRSSTRATDARIASCVDRELTGYDFEQCSKNTSWYFSVKHV